MKIGDLLRQGFREYGTGWVADVEVFPPAEGRRRPRPFAHAMLVLANGQEGTFRAALRIKGDKTDPRAEGFETKSDALGWLIPLAREWARAQKMSRLSVNGTSWSEVSAVAWAVGSIWETL